MKKRYLNTLKLEEVLQKLKAGHCIFVDNEDDHYITMVDDVICERSKDGWKVNKEFFMNGNCYFEEEAPEQEATEKDIGKLCWVSDDDCGNRDAECFIAILTEVCDYGRRFRDESGSRWEHCFPLTKEEIKEFMEKAE